MDMFKNVVMGLGMVQLFSWALGLIMFVMLMTFLGSSESMFGETIHEMSEEQRTQFEKRRTEAWYQSGGQGKVPYYGKDDSTSYRKREMGEPMVEVAGERNQSSYYSDY
jgi:ABC-type multidrug transport system fused ATPase/permease subunit